MSMINEITNSVQQSFDRTLVEHVAKRVNQEIQPIMSRYYDTICQMIEYPIEKFARDNGFNLRQDEGEIIMWSQAFPYKSITLEKKDGFIIRGSIVRQDYVSPRYNIGDDFGMWMNNVIRELERLFA